MIVADASVVAELLLRLPLAPFADDRIFGAEGGAHAPDHLNAEVLHVLRRYERARVIDEDRSGAVIADLLDLPIARYPTTVLVERAWTLRHNLTSYDALYVALAEALGASLVTADRRLSSAARTHGLIEVELLAQ